MNFTKTILNGVKVWIENQLQLVENKITDIKDWADGIFVSHNPQTLTDTQKEQARTNIGLIEETSEDALEMLAEMGVLEATTNEEGFVLTDENGNILTI